MQNMISSKQAMQQLNLLDLIQSNDSVDKQINISRKILRGAVEAINIRNEMDPNVTAELVEGLNP